MLPVAKDIPKTVGADNDSGMDNNTIAYLAAVVDNDSVKDYGIFSNADVTAETHALMDDAVFADVDAGKEDGMRADGHVLGESGRRVHDGGRMYARRGGVRAQQEKIGRRWPVRDRRRSQLAAAAFRV